MSAVCLDATAAAASETGSESPDERSARESCQGLKVCSLLGGIRRRVLGVASFGEDIQTSVQYDSYIGTLPMLPKLKL